MEFEQTEHNLTKSDLKIFEENFKLVLPEDFNTHYLKYNGGYPPFEYVKGVKNTFTINGFNPIKYGSLPIEQIITDYGKSGVSFDKKVPFAYDNGGNVFLISTDKSDYGKVYIPKSQF